MKYSDEEIQKQIQSCLMGYKELVKCFYRNYPSSWKKLDLHDRVKAGRSLVYMEQVAKNPKKFFSPEYTWGDWSNRINQFMAEYPEASYKTACLIVLGPKEIVRHKAGNALNVPFVSGDFYQKYFNFLKMVQDYEYDDRDWRKEICAESIIAESKRVNDRLEINKTCCLGRQFKKMQVFWRNITQHPGR